MTLDELKVQAEKILAIVPSDSYSHITFRCRSGGAPSNIAGIKEIHRESEFSYRTVANGSAYSGSVTIECRDTGALDMDKETIYECPDGKVFVFKYYPGSASSFDSGWIEQPNMGNK